MADHGDKMCNMTCCPCHLDLDKIKSLADNPQFICSSCGRVANSADNLCKPEPIK
ncbi:MAG: hypothetical protein ACOCXX_02890 [Planctomycetota bacterium]